MVLTCCVPNCKGNYKNGPKVAIFSFPNEGKPRQRWVNAIRREGSFVPTKTTRVCELHFRPNEVERATTHVMEPTGQVVTLDLKNPRLIKGAVPSILPNCPSYLSKPQSSQRECPKAKRQKLQYQQIEKVLAESVAVPTRNAILDSAVRLENINSKMRIRCIVVGCGSRGDRDNVSFFRVPTVQTSVHPQLHELSRKRRQKWLAAIEGTIKRKKRGKKKKLTEAILKNQRVCSKHFITGKPAALKDTSNQDWVPSVNMNLYKNGKKIISPKEEKRKKQVKHQNNVQLKESKTTKKASVPPDNQELVEVKAEKCTIINVVDDLCRICFENKSNMTQLSSVVCLNEVEPLLLIESFKYLTGESDEQINNPKYPNKICDNCISLLTSAYEFKKKYEKTSQSLNVIINTKIEEDNDHSDSDATLSAIQDDDGNFLEMDIIDDEVELLSAVQDDDGNFMEMDIIDDEAELLEILDGNESDDMFYNKLNDINETLDLIWMNEKPEATNKKLYKCPICLIPCTKFQLKEHSCNHKELNLYFDRAPIYNKKIRFYVSPSRIQTVSNRKSNLSRHTCHLCMKTFFAKEFFKHMKLHGFHMMD